MAVPDKLWDSGVGGCCSPACQGLCGARREEVDLQRRLSLHPNVVRFMGACCHIPRTGRPLQDDTLDNWQVRPHVIRRQCQPCISVPGVVWMHRHVWSQEL